MKGDENPLKKQKYLQTKKKSWSCEDKIDEKKEIIFISYYFYFFQRFISVYILLCFSF